MLSAHGRQTQRPLTVSGPSISHAHNSRVQSRQINVSSSIGRKRREIFGEKLTPLTAPTPARPGQSHAPSRLRPSQRQ
jgi:hypothetical protein